MKELDWDSINSFRKEKGNKNISDVLNKLTFDRLNQKFAKILTYDLGFGFKNGNCLNSNGLILGCMQWVIQIDADC